MKTGRWIMLRNIIFVQIVVAGLKLMVIVEKFCPFLAPTHIG
jgi:hypothetical protein